MPDQSVRTALITGITGQDGSYMADLLLSRGYRVVGMVRADVPTRYDNIEHIRDRIDLVAGSLLDQRQLLEIVERYRPREIYNFAARASSRQLFIDPVLTGEYNALAVAKWLEAIKTVDPTIRFCQASSSEMFGKSPESPQNELTPFRPRNPYGVAKLFAHGIVGTYREHEGIFACSSILFNHESPRRGTEFVTRRIAMGVARIKLGLADSLQLGSLDATRDWGYAGDYVNAMWLMLQAAEPNDYVLATGQSHSVREFCEIAFAHVGLDYRNCVRIDIEAQRPTESVRLVGDAARARTVLGWQRTVTFDQLVKMMVDADIRRLSGDM